MRARARAREGTNQGHGGGGAARQAKREQYNRKERESVIYDKNGTNESPLAIAATKPFLGAAVGWRGCAKGTPRARQGHGRAGGPGAEKRMDVWWSPHPQ